MIHSPKPLPRSPAAADADARMGRVHRWNVVIVAVLAAGLTLSIIGAYAWQGYVRTQAKDAFATNASDISAAVSSSLSQDIDFVVAQRAGVVAIPNLSNRELAIWYDSVNVKQRFPGGLGFGFVQRVLPSQLRAFGAEVVADPPINEPVTAPYTVFPRRSISVLPPTARHRNLRCGEGNSDNVRFLQCDDSARQ